jgi:putative FmdB family regulatory protein
MPTYEYRCEKCHHEFEELQSFKDDPLKVCPKCHEEALRRLFGTGAAILFKGSGFYETDYRSESYKKAAKAEQESTTKPADKPAESNGKAASSSDSSKTESKG